MESEPYGPQHQTWSALNEQIELVAAHIGRVHEKRDRYAYRSVEKALAEVELLYWIKLDLILQSIRNGKTVPTS